MIDTKNRQTFMLGQKKKRINIKLTQTHTYLPIADLQSLWPVVHLFPKDSTKSKIK